MSKVSEYVKELEAFYEAKRKLVEPKPPEEFFTTWENSIKRVASVSQNGDLIIHSSERLSLEDVSRFRDWLNETYGEEKNK